MPRKPHHRVISGLLSSWRLESRPPCIPIGRPRGVKAAGMRYQRLFEKALLTEFPSHGVTVAPWFEFRDVNGRGYCQPDAIVYDIHTDAWVIIECKLTDYEGARRQMDELYVPVVKKALGEVSGRLVVLRNVTNVTAAPRLIFEDFRLAFSQARSEPPEVFPPVFHWLGKGKLSYARTPRATFPASPSPGA